MNTEEKKKKDRARSRAYYAANKEKRRAYQLANREKRNAYYCEYIRAYRSLHRKPKATGMTIDEKKQKKRIYKAAYSAKNREKWNAYSAAYRAKNREKWNAYSAAYRAKNREKCNANSAAYRAKNREKCNATAARADRAMRKRSRELDQSIEFLSTINQIQILGEIIHENAASHVE